MANLNVGAFLPSYVIGFLAEEGMFAESISLFYHSFLSFYINASSDC